MTRMMITGCVAALALAGCGAQSPQSAAPAASQAASHEAMVARLGTRLMWDCTMQNANGTKRARLALERVPQGAYSKVQVVQAGERFPIPAETTMDGAARVYMLKDDSRLLIADDGEARGQGPNTTVGGTYTQGQCRKGPGL